ncbi:hypothetical protein [Krasilnikovia sp. MM14-A1259]
MAGIVFFLLGLLFAATAARIGWVLYGVGRTLRLVLLTHVGVCR